jgi:molybdopterin-guanine dinucleotide biosynthesis protein A
MGRDKAGVIVAGEVLWQRQLATLRDLRPRELFISGKVEAPYAASDVEIIPDSTPGRGPLSGVEASLQRATCPLMIIMAIDLPRMKAEFLARLLCIAAANGTGVVPRAEKWFEPLAAVYPRDCLPLVQQCLRSADYSMQTFVREALAAKWIIPFELEVADLALFHNANTPADLPGETGG